LQFNFIANSSTSHRKFYSAVGQRPTPVSAQLPRWTTGFWIRQI